eukprot:9492014-Pyramimonas_sp.AAC.1
MSTALVRTRSTLGVRKLRVFGLPLVTPGAWGGHAGRGIGQWRRIEVSIEVSFDTDAKTGSRDRHGRKESRTRAGGTGDTAGVGTGADVALGRARDWAQESGIVERAKQLGQHMTDLPKDFRCTPPRPPGHGRLVHRTSSD